MNTINSSIQIDLTDGSKASLTPKAADLFNLKMTRSKEAVEAKATLIDTRTKELAQLKTLQDKVDSVMTYARDLARDLATYDTSSSLYTDKKTTVTSSDATLTPSSYLTATYENSAPSAPVDIQITRLATLARLNAGQPPSIQSGESFLDMDDVATVLGVDPSTELKIPLKDGSGILSYSLGQTFDALVNMINVDSEVTGLVASKEPALGAKSYLGLMSNAANVGVVFSEGEISEFDWSVKVNPADVTFADLDTTTLSTKSISDGDILEIGSTQITLSDTDTLQDLILKINNQKDVTGVQASATKEGETYRLVLNATSRGTAITFGGNTSADVLKNLGFASSQGDYSGAVKVNGVEVATTDNTLDIGSGRSISLKQVHDTAKFTIGVENDTARLKESMTLLIGTINLLSQEILWQEGLTTDPNRSDEPLLGSSSAIDEAKKFVKDLLHIQISHAEAGYQTLGDLFVMQIEDKSHRSVDFLDLDTENFETLLETKFDTVKTLLTNRQDFVAGGNEDNYLLLSGPKRGFAALDGKEIAVTLRYDSSADKYYADFAADIPSISGTSQVTSSVEFDASQDYIAADANSIFSGIVFKNTAGTALTRLNGGGNETLTLKYDMGLAGRIFHEVLQLENQDGALFPKGSMVTLRAEKQADIEQAQSDQEKLTAKQIKLEQRYLKALARLIQAEKMLEQARMRHETLLSYMRMS